MPDPPSAIDLSVVKPESWVSWGDEKVSAWVASDGVVTSSVDTIEAILEHDTVDGTLHVILEGGDLIMLGDQVDRLLVDRELLGEPLGHIAADAAWLVSEVVAGDNTFSTEGWSQSGNVGGELALGERTSLDTSTTGSWWNAVDSGGEGVSAVVLSVDTVSRHGVGGAVEHRGGERIRGGFSPVPVLKFVRWLSAAKNQTDTYRLGTLVVTLLDQGLLVIPGEESVPCEEGRRVVDLKCLLNVNGNEVVVAILGSWGDGWVEL